jgi:hypothetical protein
MQGIRYIFCSPTTRALQTTFFTFDGLIATHDSKVAKKTLIWSALRNLGGDNPKNSEFPAYDRGASIEVLRETLKGKQFAFPSQFIKDGWENDKVEYFSRIPRADQVLQELFQFAEVAISDGKWKGMKFDPHTSGSDIHVVIVSDSPLLVQLVRDTSKQFLSRLGRYCELTYSRDKQTSGCF